MYLWFLSHDKHFEKESSDYEHWTVNIYKVPEFGNKNGNLLLDLGTCEHDKYWSSCKIGLFSEPTQTERTCKWVLSVFFKRWDHSLLITVESVYFRYIYEYRNDNWMKETRKTWISVTEKALGYCMKCYRMLQNVLNIYIGYHYYHF